MTGHGKRKKVIPLDELEKQAKIDFLWSFYDVSQDVRDLAEMINALYGISATAFDGMPHSGQKTDLADKIDGILSKQIKAAERNADALRVASVVMESITELEDRMERRVLTYRFIRFYDWDTISNKLHYSIRHVRRIYDSAIEHINRRPLPAGVKVDSTRHRKL